MKKGIFVIGVFLLLTSCTIVRASYNNPNTSYKSHLSINDIVDDGTITDEDKLYSEEIDTNHIIIEFDSSKTCYLNEILILGYEI